uniref:Uncharacterized protein n=1 Tax=Arundo donax TaxID=35708 RepID=A0A0A9FJ83_ARUDO
MYDVVANLVILLALEMGNKFEPVSLPCLKNSWPV